MKLLILLFIAIIGFSAGTWPENFANHEIRMRLSGVQHDSGKIIFALFDSEESFLEDPIRSIVVSASEWKNSNFFERLPSGTYAIAVFHDENSNGKLDKTFIGLPKEPFAFSNNTIRGLNFPSWDKASFELNEQQIEKHLELIKLSI
jgi:uncharacterized protein (DUF2141 family)